MTKHQTDPASVLRKDFVSVVLNMCPHQTSRSMREHVRDHLNRTPGVHAKLRENGTIVALMEAEKLPYCIDPSRDVRLSGATVTVRNWPGQLVAA